jgi:hypothetical protein
VNKKVLMAKKKDDSTIGVPGLKVNTNLVWEGVDNINYFETCSSQSQVFVVVNDFQFF